MTSSKKDNHLSSEFIDKIICSDSHVVLKALPDNCIDLIFTSPPYNFGLDYTEDAFAWDAYFKVLFGIFDECIRTLKYGGRIVVNVQPLFSDYIPTHHIISNFFMRKKLIWKGEFYGKRITTIASILLGAVGKVHQVLTSNIPGNF